jgi:hypothetical protein
MRQLMKAAKCSNCLALSRSRHYYLPPLLVLQVRAEKINFSGFHSTPPFADEYIGNSVPILLPRAYFSCCE